MKALKTLISTIEMILNKIFSNSFFSPLTKSIVIIVLISLVSAILIAFITFLGLALAMFGIGVLILLAEAIIIIPLIFILIYIIVRKKSNKTIEIALLIGILLAIPLLIAFFNYHSNKRDTTLQGPEETIQTPNEGDYLKSRGMYTTEEHQLYYNDYFETKDKYEGDQQREKLIYEVFKKADSLHFETIVSLGETNLPDSIKSYWIIEQRKEGETYRICWDTAATDKISKQLNNFILSMDSVWQ